MAEINLLKIKDSIHVGEIIYTKSKQPDAYILDIGLVKSLEPFTVYARSSRFNEDGVSYYGNPGFSTWHGTGVYKTYDEWEKLTIDAKGTKNICDILNIPYRIVDQEVSADEEQVNPEGIKDRIKAYCSVYEIGGKLFYNAQEVDDLLDSINTFDKEEAIEKIICLGEMIPSWVLEKIIDIIRGGEDYEAKRNM